MKRRITALALVLALFPAGSLLAAEEAPEDEHQKLMAKAVDIFRKAVRTWELVYRQTREEPEIIPLLDDLCTEAGYKGYQSFTAELSAKLGLVWEDILKREFHVPWSRAKVLVNTYLEKLRKEEKDPKRAKLKGYRPDKMVIVFLKNGSTIEGIARHGILSEKTVRIRRKGAKKSETIYLQVPAKEKDAGIRVWYIHNVEGFNFIPYTLIQQKRGIEIVRSLTLKESEQIFKDIKKKEAELRKAEKKAKAAEARIDKERTEAEKALRETEIAKKKKMDLEKARAEREKLLTKFPPSDGWSRERLNEIRRKWIINHIPPNAQEREFLALFEKWKKAKEEQDYIDGKKGG
jgi:hypothetical protein